MRRFLNKGSGQDSLATPSPEPPPYTATPPVPSGPRRAIRLVYYDENGKLDKARASFSIRELTTHKSFHWMSYYRACPYTTRIGGIDEASLDRLSLITKMTSKGLLSRFSDNRGITPRDYLEIALRPFQGSKRDVAAKNEVGQ
ncbi:hypothetical protein POM88_048209 [Heracleum sosnowskyi]|uniref:Uncharacterized protein n=1 Tax=Heracleum sosnowskyi TaxID=360622 RepID=A0AAD8GUV8_9APIA|nr:hypothetical protein POM88_048209 [Heracleum sosnowskyi]